eukprot:6191362-Pleurochrysis_carterae.AAC.1
MASMHARVKRGKEYAHAKARRRALEVVDSAWLASAPFLKNGRRGRGGEDPLEMMLRTQHYAALPREGVPSELADSRAGGDSSRWS